MATVKRPKIDVSYEAQLDVPRTPVVVCAVPEPGEGIELIRAGAEFAARLGATQVLVHTRPAPLIAAEPQIAFASPQPDARAELPEATRELARIAVAAGAGEETRIHAAFGDAERSLVDTAEREAAAYILVDARRFSRSLLGRAPCPVLVIRDAPARDAPSVTSSVLCGVDGSDEARPALRAAARLAAQLEARLVVVHVVQLPAQSSRLGPKTMVSIGAALEAGLELLERLLDEEGLSGVDRRVEYGVPPDRLAELAGEEDAELIVVGSRGRGAFRAAFLGSVSADVIRLARCPVLVVPADADAGMRDEATVRERGHAAVH